MANFRNFTLYNYNKTDKIELNSFDGYLVTTPTGVGVYFKNSYFDIGSKRIRTDQRSSYHSITMIVDIFASTRDGVEEKYSALRNFVSKYRFEGFKLSYKAYDGAQERYIECDIKDLDKSEKSTRSIMSIPLTIEPKTSWRVDEESTSTIQDEETQNEWSFDLDEDLDGTTKYDVLVANQVGSQELPIYGYDKTKLPQGLKFNVKITNLNSGNVYNEVVGLDEGTFKDGAFVIEHIFDRTPSYRNSEIMFSVYFDTANESVRAVCELEMDVSSDLSSSLYTATLMTGEKDSILKVEFDQSFVDGVCDIALYWVKKNGIRSTWSYRKQKGQLVKYITLADFASWDSVNQNKYKEVTRAKFDTIMGVDIASSYQWDINGAIYTGESNYVESFKYEEETSSYNIAMFGGAVSTNTITNDGDNEIPLRVRVFGLAVNPTIKIMSRGESTPIQTSKVNFTVPVGAYIEIDSDSENTGAWIVYATGVRNSVMKYLDNTTNMFLTLPVGSYDIQVVDDNSNPVVVTAYYKKEYFGA